MTASWLMFKMALPTAVAGMDSLPSVVGPGAGQAAMSAVPAGDLDGDGLGDLILGAPYDDSNGHEAGAIYAVFEVAQLEAQSTITDVAVQILGEAPQDYAGYSVVPAGDLDGDGHLDILVGAPGATLVQVQSGKVYRVSGGARWTDGSLGDHPAVGGSEPRLRLGFRSFAVGDVDGDGLDDAILGAPYPNGSTSWAALLLGGSPAWEDGTELLLVANSPEMNADGVFEITASDALVGRSATRGPDLDEDGLPDLVMGTPGYEDPTHQHGPPPPTSHDHQSSGAVFVLPSRDLEGLEADPSWNTEDAVATIAGAHGDEFPWILELLADERIAAATPQSDGGTGSVFFFDLSPGAYLVTDAESVYLGDTEGDLLGWGMAQVDGIDDESLLALGAPGKSTGNGQVILVSDATGMGFAADRATLVMDGCWTEGLAGTAVHASPGPDPSGEDRPWLAWVVPGASIDAEADGLSVVLSADDLLLAGGPCALNPTTTDADGDGWFVYEDCDDQAAWRNPGALEACGDGKDDDCDGAVDEACGEPMVDDVVTRCACATGVRGLPLSGLLLAISVLVGRRRT